MYYARRGVCGLHDDKLRIYFDKMEQANWAVTNKHGGDCWDYKHCVIFVFVPHVNITLYTNVTNGDYHNEKLLGTVLLELVLLSTLLDVA